MSGTARLERPLWPRPRRALGEGDNSSLRPTVYCHPQRVDEIYMLIHVRRGLWESARESDARGPRLRLTFVWAWNEGDISTKGKTEYGVFICVIIILGNVQQATNRQRYSEVRVMIKKKSETGESTVPSCTPHLLRRITSSKHLLRRRLPSLRRSPRFRSRTRCHAHLTPVTRLVTQRRCCWSSWSSGLSGRADGSQRWVFLWM
jgi:hypothetical protein